MKIIQRGNNVYARHWFRWYWLLSDRLVPIQKAEDDENN